MTGSQIGEVVEEVTTVEVHHVVEGQRSSSRRFANLKVSLSEAELPRVEKCCFLFDLRCGLSLWLIIESLVWLILFILAFYYEIIFAESHDLLDFYDATQEWYFHLIFGDRVLELDQRIRSKFDIVNHVTRIIFLTFYFSAYIVLINLLLTLIFLTYLAFCLVLLAGINMVSYILDFVKFILFKKLFLAQDVLLSSVLRF
jgi:hypothetical protein